MMSDPVPGGLTQDGNSYRVRKWVEGRRVHHDEAVPEPRDRGRPARIRGARSRAVVALVSSVSALGVFVRGRLLDVARLLAPDLLLCMRRPGRHRSTG